MDGGEADGNAERARPTRHIRAPAVSLWIALFLPGSVLAILLFTAFRRRVQMAELGTVSAQWLSEHRGYNQHYSDR
jgi:hypothetical protein